MTSPTEPGPSKAKAKRLTDKQWRAIDLELRGTPPADIQAEVGISRSQWYRWHDPVEHPAFVTELYRQRIDRTVAVTETMAAEQRRQAQGVNDVLEAMRMIALDLRPFYDKEGKLEGIMPAGYEARDRIRAAEAFVRGVHGQLELAGFKPPEPPKPVEEVKPVEQTGIGRMLQQMRELADKEGASVLEPSA